MATPIIVDCHSHIFNAEDLPIDGFIKRMSPVPSLLTGVLSLPLDRLTQWAAPGSGETATLLALLDPPPGPESAVIPESPVDPNLVTDAELDVRLSRMLAAATSDGQVGLEATGMTVDGAIAEALASATPEQLAELAAWEAEWGTEEGLVPEGVVPEGLGDLFRSAMRIRRAAKRFVDALQLVARHRYRIAGELAATYPSVTLFVPALVDFDHTARDQPATSVPEQVVVHSLVAKIAAAGRIPGASHVRIHPLVGFCPHREVRASELADWNVDTGAPNEYVPYADPDRHTDSDRYTPVIRYVAARAKPLRTPIGTGRSSRLDLRGVTRSLDIVRHAVELGGFAGVKLYPPAGFLPIGNVSRFGERVGSRLDAALRALYAYCVAEEVPILTHAARSNGFDNGFDDLASPTGWERVLGEYPSLRVCFGHFGHLHGIGPDRHQPSATSWVMRFTQLIDTHEHVYADVGNSRYVYDPDYREQFDALLDVLLGSGPVVDDRHRTRRRRLMFGSDYWMNTLNAEHPRFVDVFSERVEERVGAEATSWFMGTNALRWLGILNQSDEPDVANANRRRLVRFYPDGHLPDWLSG